MVDDFCFLGQNYQPTQDLGGGPDAPEAKQIPKKENFSSMIYYVIVGSVIVLLALGILGIVMLVGRWKRKKPVTPPNSNSNSVAQFNSIITLPFSVVCNNDRGAIELEAGTSRIKNDDLRTKTEGSRSKTEDPRTKTEDLRIKNDDLRIKTEVLRIKNEDLRIKNDDLRTKAEDLRIKTEDSRSS